MKIKSIAQSILFSVIAGGALFNPALLSNAQSRAQGTFYCGQDDGQPATIVRHSKRGDLSIIIWQTFDFGPDYTPQRRCDIVSPRFQQNQARGTFNYIVEGTLHGSPVLCASSNPPTNDVIPCSEDRLLVTLRHQDDPQDAIQTINDLNENISESAYVHTADVLVSSPDGRNLGINLAQLIYYSPVTGSGSSSGGGYSEGGDCFFGEC